jgi:hypothetical protein
MVPSSNSHLKNTTGGSYTAQRQGGTLIGLSTATSIVTKAIQVKDVNQVDQTIYPGPRELSGAKTYNTAKILSGGTFAYNSNSRSGNTWLISRVATTLAGVSKTFLLFMANTVTGPKYPYFIKDRYNNSATLIRKNHFSRTGWNTDGTKIKKRTSWITDPTGAVPATADFGTSTSIPTRAIPGELYILNNFVTYNPATSSNKYNYSAITGK